MSKNIFNEFNIWLRHEELDNTLKEELRQMKGDEKAVYEAFYRNLDFGTSGLRGIMGVGTNRMNIPVVCRVSQGIANHMISEKTEKKVVICYDSRHRSKDFAKSAASVFAANGIRTYIYKNIMPVSACSYAVRYYGASFGVMVTASHNPKEYNGYKVYDSDGCQILDDVAKQIFEATEKLDFFNDIKTMDFNEALDRYIEYIPDFVECKFVEDALKCGLPNEATGNLKVVYTPLHGSGNIPIQRILSMVGVGELNVVKNQENPDGNFPTCILPNPEDPRVFEQAKVLCDKKNCDIILATDPDCDRIGILQRAKHGYIRPRGNEIGLLLFDYICKNKQMPMNPVVVTTIVSSELIDRVAADYGVAVERTLIGFKYIGKRLGSLGNRYVFGFEEGFGYLAGDFVRDKDGVSSAMLIVQMTAYHKNRGCNLHEALEEIYNKYGYHEDRVLGFEFQGSSGIQKITDIMSELRNKDELWKKRIIIKKDYITSTNLPKANILEYTFSDETRILIRPSGTEPKLKVYLFAHDKDKIRAIDKLNENEKMIREIIKYE